MVTVSEALIEAPHVAPRGCDAARLDKRRPVCGAPVVAVFQGPTGLRYRRCGMHSDLIERDMTWLSEKGYVRLRP